MQPCATAQVAHPCIQPLVHSRHSIHWATPARAQGIHFKNVDFFPEFQSSSTVPSSKCDSSTTYSDLCFEQSSFPFSASSSSQTTINYCRKSRETWEKLNDFLDPLNSILFYFFFRSFGLCTNQNLSCYLQVLFYDLLNTINILSGNNFAIFLKELQKCKVWFLLCLAENLFFHRKTQSYTQ